MKPELSGEDVYTNFDHSFNLTEEQVKKSGKYHAHPAREFCGYVWFDTETRTFKEEIWRYKSIQETLEDDELEHLIERANGKWGRS